MKNPLLVIMACVLVVMFFFLLASLSSDARSLAVGVCFGVLPVIVMSIYVLQAEAGKGPRWQDDYQPPAVYRPTAQPQIVNNYFGPVQVNHYASPPQQLAAPPAVAPYDGYWSSEAEREFWAQGLANRVLGWPDRPEQPPELRWPDENERYPWPGDEEVQP